MARMVGHTRKLPHCHRHCHRVDQHTASGPWPARRERQAVRIELRDQQRRYRRGL